jgi:hypothetical protein
MVDEVDRDGNFVAVRPRSMLKERAAAYRPTHTLLV